MQRSTLEVAASWLACGLDPARVAFYRQSDIPEIPELTWLLTCVAGKLQEQYGWGRERAEEEVRDFERTL